MMLKNLTVAFTLTGALSAHAGFTISTPFSLTVQAGKSASGSGSVTIDGASGFNAGNVTMFAITGATLQNAAAQSHLTIQNISVNTTTIAITGSAATSDTISPFITINFDYALTPDNNIGADLKFGFDLSYTKVNGTAITQSIAHAGDFIIGVPEPAQGLAGAMLLGCGGLVFAGRRLFKKQAA